MSKQPAGLAGKSATALLLAPETPYPMAGGGALRTASILEYLAKKYVVDVIVFREPGVPDPRSAFPHGLVREITVVELPFHSKTWAGRAARNAKRVLRSVPPLVDRFAGFDGAIERAVNGRYYSIGVVEHFWCAPYFAALAGCCERLVLDLHNVESVLLARCAKTERWGGRLALLRFAQVCAGMEARLLPQYSKLLVTSDADRSQLQGMAPRTETVVYPNTIPLVRQPAIKKREEIVFSGNLEYHPNRSAIDWFHQSVWPMVQRQCPEVRWRIVGRNHEAVSARFSREECIDVAGPVEDAVMEIAAAKVAVVPILAGSGTRFKILEAWAAGTPVVSTRLGAEGLPCMDGKHLLLADDAGAFAHSIVRLLADGTLRESLSAAARNLYTEQFTWEFGWKRLDDAGL
ncbi:MAG TPA: glycosyltransferase family 4 protein [Bryobacteraceae bacterium]|nr:glycosyltransferase family 4 protein [Bryobacteraceae bacterium]